MVPLKQSDWPKYIRSGYRLYFGSHAACPLALINRFLEEAHRFSDIEIVHLATLGPAPWLDPRHAGNLRLNAFFIGANARDAVNSGEADYTPCFLSEAPRLFTDSTVPVDTAFIMVTPPDAHGYCSLGVSVDISPAAVRSTRHVVAQVNRSLPRTFGESFVHVDEIDAFIEADAPLPVSGHCSVDASVAAMIGRHCALLVDDGCCLQTGTGRIPDAVMRNLSSKNDLGVHTEVLGDGLMGLIRSGNVTNARKGLNRGKSVATFVLGSQALYDFAHENPHIEMRPADYTNSPVNIARNPNHVSINSALAVDLTGQVAADSIGGRFHSGIGGQVDFIRGAGMSPNGRPIIAMESTAKGGTVSRITATPEPGSGIVTSRGDVHYVVTEYGIATLRGRSVRERALELIQVAHPKFRDELMARALERGWAPRDTGAPRPVPELFGEGEVDRLDVGGETLFVRPLHISDQRRLQEFFYSHNEETLRQRYRTAPKSLTTDQAYRMVGVDQSRDLAFGVFSRQGPREVIRGVGRFYREGDDAEVAFVTAETMRRRGLGGLLCDRLVRVARARGIRRLLAHVRSDNLAMRHLLEKKGFVFAPCADDPTEVEGVLNLVGNPPEPESAP